jgi:hypothetical protein
VRRGEDEAYNREEEGHAVLGRRGGFDGRVHLYKCRLWHTARLSSVLCIFVLLCAGAFLSVYAVIKGKRRLF